MDLATWRLLVTLSGFIENRNFKNYLFMKFRLKPLDRC